jgi:cytochrome P450
MTYLENEVLTLPSTTYVQTISNTHNTIDKEFHGRKRRILSQGFSKSALVASEQYIFHHVRELGNALIARDGSAKEISWSQLCDMAMWN